MAINLNPTDPSNITRFQITSNSDDNSKDVSAAVAEFRYYESVLSNNITATAVMVETGYEVGKNRETATNSGILNGLPIRGGERTDIKITDNYGNDLSFKDGLYVNRIRDADPGSQKDTYYLDFASREFFANEQTRVVKRYQGKISSNVSLILKDVLKTDTNLVIDSTSIDYNFYGNDRKPFYVITWLASKSVPQGSVESGNSGSGIGGSAGYLFYQTRDSFNFRSIDNLFLGKPVKKFIYNNTQGTPDGYDASILDYVVDSNIDLQKNMSLGTYNNRSIFFDPVSFNYRVRNYGFEDQEDKINTAGKKSVSKLVAKEFTQSPTRLMGAVLDIGYNASGNTSEKQLENLKNDLSKPNFDVAQTMVQSVMRYNQLFTIQTNITIGGDFSIKAGDLIECTFPQIKGSNKTKTNKNVSGIYMVAHVCHRITSSETFTNLSLIRDSYGKRVVSS